MTPADFIILSEGMGEADRLMAAQIADGRADKASVLATFAAVRDGLRLLDPKLAERVIPRACEAAERSSTHCTGATS